MTRKTHFNTNEGIYDVPLSQNHSLAITSEKKDKLTALHKEQKAYKQQRNRTVSSSFQIQAKPNQA